MIPKIKEFLFISTIILCSIVSYAQSNISQDGSFEYSVVYTPATEKTLPKIALTLTPTYKDQNSKAATYIFENADNVRCLVEGSQNAAIGKRSLTCLTYRASDKSCSYWRTKSDGYNQILTLIMPKDYRAYPASQVPDATAATKDGVKCESGQNGWSVRKGLINSDVLIKDKEYHAYPSGKVRSVGNNYTSDIIEY